MLPYKRSFLQDFKSPKRKSNCIYIVSIILLLLIIGALAIALGASQIHGLSWLAEQPAGPYRLEHKLYWGSFAR
ncbi:hypothetical protein Y1Q_0000783 [Alligator mississippiensis]|uniref:Uncharacterized protein n=1 Tax=Alligator mississippiensis TaxID=8496 RepID=A0A151N978_ALLMI|nr:hypothetical protein Y1Q_0000783 [Alligator mississippiensis]